MSFSDVELDKMFTDFSEKNNFLYVNAIKNNNEKLKQSYLNIIKSYDVIYNNLSLNHNNILDFVNFYNSKKPENQKRVLRDLKQHKWFKSKINRSSLEIKSTFDYLMTEPLHVRKQFNLYNDEKNQEEKEKQLELFIELFVNVIINITYSNISSYILFKNDFTHIDDIEEFLNLNLFYPLEIFDFIESLVEHYSGHNKMIYNLLMNKLKKGLSFPYKELYDLQKKYDFENNSLKYEEMEKESFNDQTESFLHFNEEFLIRILNDKNVSF